MGDMSDSVESGFGNMVCGKRASKMISPPKEMLLSLGRFPSPLELF